jgi:hypothetical protein
MKGGGPKQPKPRPQALLQDLQRKQQALKASVCVAAEALAQATKSCPVHEELCTPFGFCCDEDNQDPALCWRAWLNIQGRQVVQNGLDRAAAHNADRAAKAASAQVVRRAEHERWDGASTANLTPHSIERFRILHPGAEVNYIFSMLNDGMLISNDLAGTLTQSDRRSESSDSVYVLALDYSGMFVAMGSVVVTFVRFGEFQRRLCAQLWGES